MRWLLALVVLAGWASAQSLRFVSGEYTFTVQGKKLIAQRQGKTFWAFDKPAKIISEVNVAKGLVALTGTNHLEPYGTYSRVFMYQLRSRRLLWQSKPLLGLENSRFIGSIYYLERGQSGAYSQWFSAAFDAHTGRLLWDAEKQVVRQNGKFLLTQETVNSMYGQELVDNPGRTVGFSRVNSSSTISTPISITLKTRPGCGELELVNPGTAPDGLEVTPESINVTRKDRCGVFTQSFRWIP